MVALSEGTAQGARRVSPRVPLPPGALGIAITANGDPQWPRRARQCLGAELLHNSYVVVTAKGSSGQVPGFVDRQVGSHEVFDVLAQRSELRYVLHLDDHWACHRTFDQTWLSRALAILEQRSDVDRVSLLHRADTPHNREPGEVERGFAELGAGPLTDEPSLLRLKVLRSLPARGRATGRPRRLWRPTAQPPTWVTVQLFPGVSRRPTDR